MFPSLEFLQLEELINLVPKQQVDHIPRSKIIIRWLMYDLSGAIMVAGHPQILQEEPLLNILSALEILQAQLTIIKQMIPCLELIPPYSSMVCQFVR